ncbi:MAG: LuxR family transcriptional regulator [Pedobacter sp.]|nr:MAG: LuxR family transcriptional regulator [Pedobacter sp.]
MAKNNHPSTTDIRDKLDIKLFSQHFSGFSADRIELKDAKVIAQLYATLENTISVLSDLVGRKSYLYLGGVADQLGFEPTSTEINSIWEDELLSRVHPDDLQKKYRLEFSFFQLLKSIALSERTNYSLITKLRIKTKKGKYLSIKHRLLYLSSTGDGNVSLALCLYDIIYDYPGFDVPDGLIINTATGAILGSEQGTFEDMLSAREIQILHMISIGLRSKEIAEKLSLSLHTVNRHRQNIFQKLNVDNAMEACRLAQATGLLHRS